MLDIIYYLSLAYHSLGTKVRTGIYDISSFVKKIYIFKNNLGNWRQVKKILLLVVLRVGFEPTPFRTRTLIWRLRPTRPSQPVGLSGTCMSMSESARATCCLASCCCECVSAPDGWFVPAGSDQASYECAASPDSSVIFRILPSARCTGYFPDGFL
jgi:hypothetical protein